MSSEPAVQLTGIWKKYSRQAVFHRSLREDIVHLFSSKTNKDDLERNEFWALKNICLEVKKGEVVGLYGPNGSGKSTILKIIANVTPPTRGDVCTQGRIAPLLEVGAGFHPDLSGRENIFVNGAILGMRIPEIRQKIKSIADFSGVQDFIDMPVKKYSSGMYVRLAFSIAIHSEAKIYLLDEVLSVGDAAFQSTLVKKIKTLKQKNKTIIIVSQKKEALRQNTDRIFLLEESKIQNISV